MIILKEDNSFDPQDHFFDLPFEQSKLYGELHEALGRKVIKIVGKVGDKPKIFAQCIAYDLPIFGRIWYVPYGPIGRLGNKEYEQVFINEIKKECSDGFLLRLYADVLSIKLPVSSKRIDNFFTLNSLVYMVPLFKNKEILIENLSSNLKEKIDLDEKNQSTRIIIESHDFLKYKETFLNLLEATLTRQKKMYLYSNLRDRYLTLLSLLGSTENKGFLVLGYHENKILSIMIVVTSSFYASYSYYASSDEAKEYEFRFLSQWAALNEAHRRECLLYNFGAVSLNKSSKNNAILLNFYKGLFNGFVKIYNYPSDIVLDQKKYRKYIYLNKPYIKNVYYFIVRHKAVKIFVKSILPKKINTILFGENV